MSTPDHVAILACLDSSLRGTEGVVLAWEPYTVVRWWRGNWRVMRRAPDGNDYLSRDGHWLTGPWADERYLPTAAAAAVEFASLADALAVYLASVEGGKIKP